ncbi:MAG: hypothetical protein ISS81_01395 [Candidatus Marinimicrobia bacterium]|nr:hypothetical protein [Candidatus Neomarinimicrobiota bacterium]
MKKLILLTICISFSATVLCQEMFTIPEYSVEQKHNSMVNSFWSHLIPGIRFAKSHNVSPYEYGAFYGKLFAESRASKRASSGSAASFKNYAQRLLNSWSKFIKESDSKSVIEKESDSLLIFKIPSGSYFKNMGYEGRWGVTSDELFQMMNGSHEQISKDYGCTTKMVLEGDWIVVTIKKIQ